jgi:hypothetical protein
MPSRRRRAWRTPRAAARPGAGCHRPRQPWRTPAATRAHRRGTFAAASGDGGTPSHQQADRSAGAPQHIACHRRSWQVRAKGIPAHRVSGRDDNATVGSWKWQLSNGIGGWRPDESTRSCSLLVTTPFALLLNGSIYRARPRNTIIACSISTSCSAASRPTRAWTFDLLTVVSLSIITSLS